MLVLISGAQCVWIIHNHRKFLAYKAMWDTAKAQWDEARGRNDPAAMRAAYRREQECYAAEQRVSSDNFLPPWKWIKRWDHDYLSDVECNLSGE